MWRLNQPCVTTPVAQTLPLNDYTGKKVTFQQHQKPHHNRMGKKCCCFVWLFSSVNQRFISCGEFPHLFLFPYHLLLFLSSTSSSLSLSVCVWVNGGEWPCSVLTAAVGLQLCSKTKPAVPLRLEEDTSEARPVSAVSQNERPLLLFFLFIMFN